MSSVEVSLVAAVCSSGNNKTITGVQGEERSAPLEDVESSTNIHTLYRTEESRCVVRAQHPEATLEGCIQILESALFAISFD